MAINALTTIEQQYTIISDVHKGLGHDPKAKTIASHRGNSLAIQKISNRSISKAMLRESLRLARYNRKFICAWG